MSISARRTYLTIRGDRVRTIRTEPGMPGWWLVRSVRHAESPKSPCSCKGCETMNQDRRQASFLEHESGLR